MRADELRSLSIFDGLTDDQLTDLIKGGTEVSIEPGVDLFHEGDHAAFWWLLIEGAIDLILVDVIFETIERIREQDDTVLLLQQNALAALEIARIPLRAGVWQAQHAGRCTHASRRVLRHRSQPGGHW